MTSTPLVGTRVRSLDGLRGLAALVVVVHHAVQLTPEVDEALYGEVARFSLSWWLTFTPLHLVWAGEEAVLLFFVLSGFVLTLPALRAPLHWPSYYRRRLVRLYLPVWASLLVAMAVVATLAGSMREGQSAYLDDRSSASLLEAPRDALLVLGTGSLNGPLWSLQWEVWFSLLLPAYLLLGLARRRWALVLAGGLLLVSTAGLALDAGALTYLPVFGLGVLMAFHQGALAAVAGRVAARRRSGLLWWLLLAVTLVLLSTRWLRDAFPLPGGVDALVTAAGGVGPFLGAALAVFLVLHGSGPSRLLARPTWQWLGRVSFSLYLVHEPVVLTCAAVLRDASPWVAAVVALPLSLLAAAVFYRYVEAPALRAARRAGSRTIVLPDAGSYLGPVAPAQRDQTPDDHRQHEQVAQVHAVPGAEVEQDRAVEPAVADDGEQAQHDERRSGGPGLATHQ